MKSVPQFCFPNDIKFHYGSSPPPETVHSFVSFKKGDRHAVRAQYNLHLLISQQSTTDEEGNKKYGTCVTFYERLPKSLYDDIKACVAEWVKGNMVCIG